MQKCGQIVNGIQGIPKVILGCRDNVWWGEIVVSFCVEHPM